MLLIAASVTPGCTGVKNWRIRSGDGISVASSVRRGRSGVRVILMIGATAAVPVGGAVEAWVDDERQAAGSAGTDGRLRSRLSPASTNCAAWWGDAYPCDGWLLLTLRVSSPSEKGSGR